MTEINPNDPYLRIVMLFDRDKTAGEFLREDGEGGFVGAVYRMAREIDRLRSAHPPQEHVTGVDEAATKAAFSHGYLLACCNVANLHGHPEIAFDILSELGISKAEVEAMDLCDYDLDALKEIETARGNKSLYRDATTEGQP
jgi:hypothetical protein